MNKLKSVGMVLAVTVSLVLSGCANGQLTNSAGTQITTALETVANVLQQQNTGVQTAAPTVNSVLTQTDNQGDTAVVNDVVAADAVATPALEALLSLVNTAVSSNTAPAAQIAAVNNALSPTSIATVVAAVAPVTTASVPTSN